MKKIAGFIIIALLTLVVMPANAQFKFGVKGGVNISSVSFDSNIVSGDNITGFNVGPMIELMVPVLGLGFDAAALYSQRGTSINGGDVKTDYLDVPVNLKWKIGVPIVKAYLTAGPYFSFRVAGDEVWNIPNSVSDQLKAKSFDTGLNFGAGVELLKHLQVGFNYAVGLTDNYEIVSITGTNDGSGKNRGWSISAAYLF